MLALLLACRAGGHADPDDPLAPTLTTPTLAEVSVLCDPEAEEWQIGATATSWTGGGRWFVSADGDYVEEHRIATDESAADGSRETLSASVSIVGDWRNAGDGASVLHCNETVGWRITIDDTAGALADCVEGGAPIAWPDDVPRCE